MKLLSLFLMAACLQVSAASFGQSVTLKSRGAKLENLFDQIRKQSGYEIIYNSQMLENAGKVDVDIANVSVTEALNEILKGQPLDFVIKEKTIIIKAKQVAPVTEGLNPRLDPTPIPPANIEVKGKVTDAEGKPLIGATVIIKGMGRQTQTNNQGEFTLTGVDDKATIVISFVGYATREFRPNTTISASLVATTSDLDEVVTVAYNTTTMRKNVAAVTVVNHEQFETVPVRSVDKALQGLVPGLLVTSGNGQPGGGLTNFVLRGVSTAVDPFGDFSTVRNPLIVIDGVPVTQDNYQWAGVSGVRTPIINPMAQLNPADVESVTVLKDAAAIALYGSKASNGVILLTTKKGKQGKTITNFRTQADISVPLKGKVQYLNQQEYLELVSETLRNSSPTAYPNDAAVMAYLKTQFPVKSNGNLYPFTDWEDELYNDKATTLSNNLSFSGGNDKSNFFINLGYTKQNGVVKKTGLDQKSIRINIDNRPVNWLKWGLNTSLSYSIQDYGAPVGSPIAGSEYPLNPVRLEDGSYFLNFKNPVMKPNPAAFNEYNTNRNTSYRALSKLSGEINFLNHFKFNTALGVDFMLLEAKETTAPGFNTSNTPNMDGYMHERNTRNVGLIATNHLSYTNQWKNNHSLSILIGQEAQVTNTKMLDVSASKIRLPGLYQISSFDPSTISSSGGEVKKTLLSWLGQANYGYKNRYFVSASYRADGSSNFGERNRFGKFWSIGAGWIASGENFMKGTASWLQYLKFRGSLGAAGNSFAIDRNVRYDQLRPGTYLNSLALYPDQGSNPGNPEIQWERTFTWDAGLEAKLWNNRVTLTADIYEKKTYDAVALISLPYVTGYTTVLDNIGDINNKGVELSIALDIIKSRDFHWNLNVNWSTNKNILVKTSNPLTYVGNSGTLLANIIGKPLNGFYMVRWVGVDPATGSGMWMDSTGKPSTNPAAVKQDYVGKPAPDGFGAITNSITYKNIQLTALLYYQYGYQVNTSGLVNDGTGPLSNQDKSALNRWQKPGDITPNPKRDRLSIGSGGSTRFLYSGDYIRLQTLTVTYNFPKKILSRLSLSMLKVYAQAYNLALWTKYPGFDIANISPTGSIGGGQYPNGQSYSIGIGLNF